MFSAFFYFWEIYFLGQVILEVELSWLVYLVWWVAWCCEHIMFGAIFFFDIRLSKSFTILFFHGCETVFQSFRFLKWFSFIILSLILYLSSLLLFLQIQRYLLILFDLSFVLWISELWFFIKFNLMLIKISEITFFQHWFFICVAYFGHVLWNYHIFVIWQLWFGSCL